MDSTLPKIASVAVLVLFAVSATGCSSQPERPDDEIEAADRAAEQEPEVEEPSDEELADSPCGNPDWAQLPPGAEDTPEGEPEPSDEESSGEEDQEGARLLEGEDAASRAEIVPCR